MLTMRVCTYIGCTVITKPTPKPCNKRAINISGTLRVTNNNTYATTKNTTLPSRVHFLPIFSAKGPAMNGAVICFCCSL